MYKPSHFLRQSFGQSNDSTLCAADKPLARDMSDFVGLPAGLLHVLLLELCLVELLPPALGAASSNLQLPFAFRVQAWPLLQQEVKDGTPLVASVT
jgi:hypothetical protein